MDWNKKRVMIEEREEKKLNLYCLIMAMEFLEAKGYRYRILCIYMFCLETEYKKEFSFDGIYILWGEFQ